MTKWLVETTGDFMFTDTSANQDIQPHRPSVVKPTAFIKMKVDDKKIKVLEDNLDDDMTDENYEKEWDAKQSGNKKLEAKQPERSENKPPVQGKKERDEDFAKRMDAWKEANPGWTEPKLNP